MILNTDLTFERAPDSVRKAFLGPAEKLLLNPGTRLYKWTHRPLVGAGGITPWWFFFDRTRLPNGRFVDGFEDAAEYARRLGKPDRAYARARGAISDEFANQMTDLLKIELTSPAWGFAGKVSGQPEFAKERADLRHVYLIGGADQLWLPSLTARHVRRA